MKSQCAICWPLEEENDEELLERMDIELERFERSNQFIKSLYLKS